jgi:hypothetical protein
MKKVCVWSIQQEHKWVDFVKCLIDLSCISEPAIPNSTGSGGGRSKRRHYFSIMHPLSDIPNICVKGTSLHQWSSFLWVASPLAAMCVYKHTKMYIKIHIKTVYHEYHVTDHLITNKMGRQRNIYGSSHACFSISV